MPVSFAVASHPAEPVYLRPGLKDGLTGEEILAEACLDQYKKVAEVLQFGLADTRTKDQGKEAEAAEGLQFGLDADTESAGRDFTTKIPDTIPNHNGFVNTVMLAYNQHHALVIRPDDVWLTILAQFNYFVNANAELLRASLVAHEGKKKLVITQEGSRHSLDYSAMAQQMVDLIDQNIADPTLRAWALPAFTTTTDNDTTVAAVLLMATLKEYFSYGFSATCCGIPRVTLEGERADWVTILVRLEKLKEYGIETIAWYHLLRPVLARFVAAFDTPESEENVDFWGKIAHYEGGSGPPFYSGWINAFNVFSKKGEWLGTPLNMTIVAPEAPESMSAETFWVTYPKRTVRRDLVLDGTPFHHISGSLPPSYAEVDVTLDDNGKLFDCMMVAGVIGTRVSSSGDPALSAEGKDDTVRPAAGWWMFIKR
ncbi:hypothetical protein C8R44DRAFT_806753 [Mycena epipterygia]|nr:hypothetical protein C8R44DRAFT_806753 [Mycena epipterygia]